MAIISTRNLNLYYGDKQAINNVNMEIEKNEITALIGPSGCGKSTFLRVLNRMNDIIPGCKITGEVIYDDINIYGNKIDPMLIRKKIGMVFQKPNPFPSSIYDNIAYAPKYHGKRKGELDEIVESSLKAAALWEEVKDRLRKSALSLSGGQQQRLCIARTIALNPEVILLDEATSALDPISSYKIEDLLIKLKKSYTVVIVTHNMQQASRIADKTAFFLMGDLVEFDTTDKIFTNPRNKKTSDYVCGHFG
ncbi:phosphate ABC transporter ATP-binding protein PstB [Anaerocolumna sp. AGMB13025]|uniref:phosphate ABC transporter ATP-binding protein PstB n=1 Tax=Anaerocolumna sp. AGMB13025 TaxID=3039116 RepID=UPI00241C83F1|nr:phosphate ABC transporter ATP-binding protein PstB [Anaerocolumna sp. AGMB13025]WFR57299.1 phosphate ABC transporter ATP-binding protein PstB [Anaerocolumna sp. AGMB13025]